MTGPDGPGPDRTGTAGRGWLRASVALYRLLLRRYPSRLRQRFGAHMAEAFRLQLEEASTRGSRAVLRRWWTTLIDLTRPLPGEVTTKRPEGGGGAMETPGIGGGGTWAWLGGVDEDLRYAVRSLTRDARFTTVVVLVLGFGLALNAAVFSVVNAYLLRPLPYPDAERIVRVDDSAGLSWTQVGDYFDRAVSWDLDVFTLVGAEGAELVRGSWITPDFMDTYGVRPALGRSFRPEEAGEGAPPVALISHRLWTERFGADPGVIGRSFEAFTSDRPDHAESFRVIGVLEPDFWHVNDFTEVLVPLRVERDVYAGRLRPGMPLEDAEAGLNALAREVAVNPSGERTVELTRLQDAHVAAVRPTLSVLQVAALLVLVIACANAVVLLLVRSARRDRELGVRAAMGAPRLRIVRQLILEGGLLAAGAAVVGLLAAVGLLEGTGTGLERRLGQSVPGGLDSLGLDLTVVVATGFVCVAVGAVFGLAPSAMVLRGTGRGLAGRDRGGSDSRARRRVRDSLVLAEVALSMALLAGAGLMVRSALHLQTMDLGFEPERITRGALGLRRASYPDVASRAAFFEEVVTRVRALPDVEAAGLTSSTPFTGIANPTEMEAEAGRDGVSASGVVASVGAGYFETMGIRLLEGREVSPEDVEGGLPVAVVSETVAATLWPGGSALGQRIRAVPQPGAVGDPPTWYTVVGVTADIVRDLRVDADGQVYLAWRQNLGLFMTLTVRRRPGVVRIAEPIQEIVTALDADVPFSGASELADAVAEARAPTRFTAALLGTFSAFALVLSVVGLYGVIAYAARRRRRDVAIRVALGADSGSVTGLFLRQGLTIVVAGILVGAVGGLGLGRALGTQLSGIAPDDAITHGSVALGLLLTAAIAVWLPARGAARTTPMEVLREE